MAESIERIIERDGYVIKNIKGVSMNPMLDQNTDLVKIVPSTSILKVGDLPLFKRPNGDFVIHRVIGVRKNYYRICGDNQNFIEKVPHEWIIGVVEGFYKNGKYVPCTDENYLKYVKKTCKRLRRVTFLTRYNPKRILRKLMRRNKNG